jgi:hypothetical protein
MDGERGRPGTDALRRTILVLFFPIFISPFPRSSDSGSFADYVQRGGRMADWAGISESGGLGGRASRGSREVFQGGR